MKPSQIGFNKQPNGGPSDRVSADRRWPRLPPQLAADRGDPTRRRGLLPRRTPVHRSPAEQPERARGPGSPERLLQHGRPAELRPQLQPAAPAAVPPSAPAATASASTSAAAAASVPSRSGTQAEHHESGEQRRLCDGGQRSGEQQPEACQRRRGQQQQRQQLLRAAGASGTAPTGSTRGRKSRIYPNPNQHIVVTSNSVDNGGIRMQNATLNERNAQNPASGAAGSAGVVPAAAGSGNGISSSTSSPHHMSQMDVKDTKVTGALCSGNSLGNHLISFI